MYKHSFIAALALMSAATVQAEQVLAPDASTDDFANALRATRTPAAVAADPYGDTRAIRPSSSKGVAAARAPAADGVSVQIQFEYNSDRLTPSARAELDKLGKALVMPDLAADKWVLEGHTDASGTERYNQDLSERRARSVQRYLIDRHGVEPKRLQTVGFGETDPLLPDDPENSANRRVRIKFGGR